MRIFLTLVLSACLLTACAGTEETVEKTADTAASHAEDAVEAAGDAVSDLANKAHDAIDNVVGGVDAEVADLANALSKTLAPQDGETVLAGMIGCGHCTFEKGEGCSAAMRTVNGDVVILEGVTEDTETFNQRFSGKPVAAVGVLNKGEDFHTMAVREHRI